MAKVTIGGIEYLVTELNFCALERAWPFIDKAMSTNILTDPLGGPAAAIMVIAAGLVEEESFNPANFGITPEEQLNEDQIFHRVGAFLKKKLKSTEINLVRECLEDIIKEAGLEAAPGEALEDPLTEEENLLLATAQASSQSSLPLDAKEEAGSG